MCGLTVQTGFGVSDHILATLMNVIIRNGAMMAGIMLTQLLVTLLYVHFSPFFGCDTPRVLPRRTSRRTAAGPTDRRSGTESRSLRMQYAVRVAED